MSSDLEKRIELLANRITVLRDAVRLNDFRLAQRLRMALVAYAKDIEGPVRDDIVQLFEITGFWLRNVDNRHKAKRQAQQIIRRIIPRLRPLEGVGRHASATTNKKM